MLKKKITIILFPTLLTLFYVVFMYFFITYEWNNERLVSVHGTSPIDIKTKFLCDFIGSLLIVIVILSITFIQKKPLREIGLTLKSHKLVIAFSVLYHYSEMLSEVFGVGATVSVSSETGVASVSYIGTI